MSLLQETRSRLPLSFSVHHTQITAENESDKFSAATSVNADILNIFVTAESAPKILNSVAY